MNYFLNRIWGFETQALRLTGGPQLAGGLGSCRPQVMLYDDDQGDCITPEHVFETLEEDLKVSDLGRAGLRGAAGVSPERACR